MAGITAEGTLWIELADVFGWLTQAGMDTEGATGKVVFSIENDALQIPFSDGRTKEIDAVEFWTWVIDKHLPTGIAHYETVFGVPKVEGPDLTITFAVGSETNPRNWAREPACLAEWKATGGNFLDNIIEHLEAQISRSAGQSGRKNHEAD